jgi:hypothetical protein
MSWFLLLFLIALAAGGWYLYQRLLTIEREIRQEQRQAAAEAKQDSAPADLAPDSSVEKNGAVQAPAGEDLNRSILAFVALNQGLPQAELYTQFPANDRRELQKRLRELEQSGRLRREKEGSTYRLYPL